MRTYSKFLTPTSQAYTSSRGMEYDFNNLYHKIIQE